MTQVFFIDGPLPGANDFMYKHWRVHSKLKSSWGLITRAAIRHAKIKPVGHARISCLWMEQATTMKKHRRDPDNFIFAQKIILDAIVKEGILIDDSMDYVLALNHTWVEVSRGPGVQVTLDASNPEDLLPCMDEAFARFKQQVRDGGQDKGRRVNKRARRPAAGRA